jgi:hypothetical protein
VEAGDVMLVRWECESGAADLFLQISGAGQAQLRSR